MACTRKQNVKIFFFIEGETAYAAYAFSLSSSKEEILWDVTFIQFSLSAMLNQQDKSFVVRTK